MSNILILSAGTRNKIIQYFNEAVRESGKVICTDLSNYAPAIYEADGWYQTPPLNDESYIKDILSICERENITGIVSLIDPELKVLAENKSLFDKRNIKLLQSPLDIINMSFDKYNFFEILTERGFKSQRSYLQLDKVKEEINNGLLEFPLFVKPNLGSASVNINKVYNLETLEILFANYDDLIVQEYINGKEYGIDVYIDFISKEIISIFIKEKIRMKAGETDKSIAVKDNRLMDMIEHFVKEMNYLGQIDIDVFEREGEYFISEVNPRFGGGYPHAYNAGCNYPKYIVNNLKGKTNTPEIGNYKAGTVMMKYNEVKFLEGGVELN